MFDSVKPHPEWRLLVEATRSLQHGEVVTHEALERLTGLRRNSSRWKYTIDRWKKALLEDHGMDVESVPGVGYRRLDPDQFIGHARKKVTAAGRRLRKGTAILSCTLSDTALTPEQRQVQENVLLQTAALASMHRRSQLKIGKTIRQFEPPGVPRALPGRPGPDRPEGGES